MIPEQDGFLFTLWDILLILLVHSKSIGTLWYRYSQTYQQFSWLCKNGSVPVGSGQYGMITVVAYFSLVDDSRGIQNLCGCNFSWSMQFWKENRHSSVIWVYVCLHAHVDVCIHVYANTWQQPNLIHLYMFWCCPWKSRNFLWFHLKLESLEDLRFS